MNLKSDDQDIWEEKIVALVDWTISPECPDSFDPTFINDIAEFFERTGSLSQAQEEALDKIAERYHVEY